MQIHDYMVAKAQIWGAESHACSIIFDGRNAAIKEDGKYFAECGETLDRRRLTDSNYREVLNDMFYDYCVANAAWMGVS